MACDSSTKWVVGAASMMVCTNCGICLDRFACPAIQRPEPTPEQSAAMESVESEAAARKVMPKPVILHLLCSACGVCGQKQVCAIGAIRPPDEAPPTSGEAGS